MWPSHARSPFARACARRLSFRYCRPDSRAVAAASHARALPSRRPPSMTDVATHQQRAGLHRRQADATALCRRRATDACACAPPLPPGRAVLGRAVTTACYVQSLFAAATATERRRQATDTCAHSSPRCSGVPRTHVPLPRTARPARQSLAPHRLALRSAVGSSSKLVPDHSLEPVVTVSHHSRAGHH